MSTLPKNIRELPLQEQAFVALQSAVKKAIEEHARAGRSVFVAKDGKVVEIPAATILARSRKRSSESAKKSKR